MKKCDFNFVDDFVLCLASPRRSGKSWFVKQYLHKYRKQYDKIIIISPSLDVNGDYDEFKDDDNFEFVSNIRENTVDKVFNDSYVVSKQTKKLNSEIQTDERKRKRPVYRVPKVLVILDDIVDSGCVRFGGSCDKIAERGRHVGITCIICAQRITAISRSIRLNSDYFIIFKTVMITEAERFLEEYVGHAKRKDFREGVLEEIFSHPYHFIMVDTVDKQHALKSSIAEELMKGCYEIISF